MRTFFFAVHIALTAAAGVLGRMEEAISLVLFILLTKKA